MKASVSVSSTDRSGYLALQLVDQPGDMEPAKRFWRIDLYQSPDTGVPMRELVCSAIQQLYGLTYLRVVALPLLGEPDGTRAPIKQLLSQFFFQTTQ